MASNFFGLKPEHKDKIHEELFTLLYYSNGGFGHTEVYQMPVYLKRYYLRHLTSVKKKEQKNQEQANKGTSKPRIPRR